MNNHVQLKGILPRDPTLKYTPTGKAVCKFTLAVKRSDKEDAATDYISCVAWEELAESVATYAEKGSLCEVQGQLRSGSYVAQDGSKRYYTEVNCSTFAVAGSTNATADPDGAFVDPFQDA